MREIHVLDSVTVDKIAAGEVVERPLSVVKELVENSIDAGAHMITVDITDGGISQIRISDDGSGIDRSQVEKAFLRHATSKIRTAEDLTEVTSLGFRGEALSSICAVCQVEMITKTREELVGTRVCVNGGVMQAPEEVGAPDGTTMIVRNIFYNTPARQKFLKSKATEGSYISDMMQHLALSKPDIAFKFIQNGQTRFFTSGNGNVSEIIYRIYGKEVSENMIQADLKLDGLALSAYLGKPVLNRASRSFETFFVNGRYIKSSMLSQVLEEGYKNHLMQHKFPFAVLYFTIDTGKIDVNVHPTKMDIRIEQPEQQLLAVRDFIKEVLLKQDLIPAIPLTEEKISGRELAKAQRELTAFVPEPFEKVKAQNLMREITPYKAERIEKAEQEESASAKNEFFEERISLSKILAGAEQPPAGQPGLSSNIIKAKDQQNLHPFFGDTEVKKKQTILKQKDHIFIEKPEQMDLSFDKFFEESSRDQYQILGQIFETYWLITCHDKLYIMDQHAAHEKVMYEKLFAQMKEHTIETQQLNPPIIITMTQLQQQIYKEFEAHFTSLGFVLEEFGGDEFALRQIPLNLYGYDAKELFLSVLDALTDSPIKADVSLILEKIASMSCKAAVKGNQKISAMEAQTLVDELFTLENPYNCPHGRPTVISMSKYEIEKKFKRIV
ncbi:MAG: DNA mismatch repair endonuclease MutL [Lachnospiraceae bacterium]|nr:DNA mismatch repair endonuclease MutL [Lachnospiraceae bacterium]